MNRDFMGIVLEVGQESSNTEMRRLYEDVRDGRFVEMFVYNLETLNEAASEPLSYQGLKTVKEKFGRGVSLTSGSVEKRFVSDKYTAEELEGKVKYLLEHQEPAKISDWLQINTLCYFTQNLNEDVAEETESTEEVTESGTSEEVELSESAADWVIEIGDIVTYKDSEWVVFDNGVGHQEALIFKNKKEFETVPFSQLKLFNGSVNRKLKNLSDKAVESSDSWENFRKKLHEDTIDEATQASDAATKIDQGGSKYPVKGRAYEFDDGNYVVEEIIDDVVYLIGPDDEYYSMSVEDFQNEVIAPMNEAELEDEFKFEKMVKAAFPGWVFEKVNDDTDKTGIVMYALAKGNDDVIVFVHLGEETYDIYSDEDDKAPELEGKLSSLKSGLSKMAKYFKA